MLAGADRVKSVVGDSGRDRANTVIHSDFRKFQPALRKLRLLAVTLMLTQLSACATRPPVDNPGVALQFSTEVDICSNMISMATDVPGDELDARDIRVFNWNVHKKRAAGWRDDYDAYAADADLILFQEASLREDNIGELDATRYWSFAPGYRRHGEVTGVMTLSNAKPLTQCSFVHYEPLLRTPKATSISQYALTDTDETLIVVNVHAINFSLGLGAFEDQFAEIGRLLDAHHGPVILSGDFNTWRPKRTRIVESLAGDHGLTAVNFAHDHRVRFFGNVLDHIYVRGLDPVDADTEIVSTSDHNPMSVALKL